MRSTLWLAHIAGFCLSAVCAAARENEFDPAGLSAQSVLEFPAPWRRIAAGSGSQVQYWPDGSQRIHRPRCTLCALIVAWLTRSAPVRRVVTTQEFGGNSQILLYQ